MIESTTRGLEEFRFADVAKGLREFVWGDFCDAYVEYVKERLRDPEKRPVSCREFVEDLTGHSTRRLPTTDSSTPIAELWYLVYRDDEGTVHTVKGTTDNIRKAYREGLLGDASNIRAARTKQRAQWLLRKVNDDSTWSALPPVLAKTVRYIALRPVVK